MDEHTTNTSEQAVKRNLVDKARNNDYLVFERLRIEDVADLFVDRCMENFERDNEEHIQRLIKIENGSIRTGRRCKSEMHEPWLHIMNYIRDFQDMSSAPPVHKLPFPRQIIDESQSAGDKTAFDFDYLELRPDFSFISPNPNLSARACPVHLTPLRQVSGHLDTKYKKDTPDTHGDSISKILYHSFDYARIHMASHPFNLFSIGLMISGNVFHAGIFDCDGVSLSPETYLWDTDSGKVDKNGMRTFIKVIRSVTCVLSEEGVGHDPTVQVLNDSESKVPVYRLSLGGNDTRLWQTVGAPYWTSISYIGRRTSVWAVQQVDSKSGKPSGDIFILKNAWRARRRTPESNIYRSLKGDHPGLAKCFDGRDVFYPAPNDDKPITVYGVRGHDPDEHGVERYLHRLLLVSVGQPLWEYESELQLLRALRAATLAHQFMTKQGILHCDISAGNILLNKSTSPPPGGEGFLCDLELARLDNTSTVECNTEPASPAVPVTAKPSTVDHVTTITGTNQFMAIELLAWSMRQGKTKVKIPPHGIHHDLESIIWVTAYAVMKHIHPLVLQDQDLSPDDEQDWLETTQDAFGRSTLRSVHNSRTAMAPLMFFGMDSVLISPVEGIVRKYVSETMRELLVGFADLVERQNIRLSVKMTYDDVLVLLNVVIAKMEAETRSTQPYDILR